MRSILTMVMVLLIAGRAAAQPAEPLAPPPLPEELSQATAVGLSVGTTLVAWTALIATASIDGDNHVALPFAGIAVLVAPGLGQWYAGSLWTRGLALRTGGLLSLGLAVSQAASCPDFGSCGSDRLGKGLAIAAIALYAAGTIDDIVTAPRAVRRHNEQLRSIALVPIVRRNAGGLALATQF